MNTLIRKQKTNFLIALLIAIIFFIYNFVLIYNGHFHEDAYILFVYVENIVDGNGMTYYPGGPHIEGAIDFLWIGMLVVLVKLGLDTGTSAILLNSFGVLIISFLLSNEIFKSKIKSRGLLFCLYAFLFFWIFWQPLYAAVGGFCIFLYMALVLSAFVSVHKEKYILFTPYIALVIALFRSDGVIIGIGFVLVGFYKAYKRDQVKRYIFGMGVGLFVGISYFAWRYNYFGNLLPLPLYVKGHGSLIAGLKQNCDWIIKNSCFLFPILFLSILNKRTKYYLLLSLPVILLFLALVTATQMQNIGYRFQAPIFIIVYYILVLLIIEYIEIHTVSKLVKTVIFIYMFGFALKGGSFLNGTTRGITRFNYINQVPLAINKNLPKNMTIALTEAGRMAYWNQSGNHKIIDLVGLNSEFPSKNTISIQYLEKLSPDVIMYHHAYQLDVQWLSNNDEKVVLLTNEDKKYLVNKYKYSDLERVSLAKVKNASIVATQFIQKYFNEYDIFIAYYHGDYKHIYAFKKRLNLRSKMNALLLKGFQRNTALSYYDMQDTLHK